MRVLGLGARGDLRVLGLGIWVRFLCLGMQVRVRGLDVVVEIRVRAKYILLTSNSLLLSYKSNYELIKPIKLHKVC